MSRSPSTSEQSGLNGGKASDWLRPYAPNWALFAIAGGVRLSIIELRRTRQLRAVSAPRSVHTGGKSEAQLTKKQAVLLMHNIYINSVNCMVKLFIIGYYNYTEFVALFYINTDIPG